MLNNGKYRDIEVRTFEFSIEIIKNVLKMPNNVVTWKLGGQIISSSTSINSNIVQARAGFSRKDFIHHMRISLKEAKETKRWLEMLASCNVMNRELSCVLIKENEEIICILVTIIKNTISQSNNINQKAEEDVLNF